jgi:FkbM family methyltransferase
MLQPVDSRKLTGEWPIPVVDRANTSRRVRIAASLLQALGKLPGYRGRGLSIGGSILGKFCRDDELVLSISPHSRVCVRLSDAYWVRHLVFREPYEPEVFSILSRLSRVAPDVLFVDCGANCGYWSALCSGEPFNWRCVALEPSPAVITLLERTNVLNGGRFQLEQAAVWDIDGLDMPFRECAEPAGSHLITDVATDGGGAISVRTTTLDSIVGRHGGGSELVVVKLDVEDTETNAFRGATETVARRDVLFVYEDHGSDPACRVTRLLLEELHLNVFHAQADGTIEHIPTADSAKAVKTNPNRGYNFVAVRPDGTFAKRISEFAGGG